MKRSVLAFIAHDWPRGAVGYLDRRLVTLRAMPRKPAPAPEPIVVTRKPTRRRGRKPGEPTYRSRIRDLLAGASEPMRASDIGRMLDCPSHLNAGAIMRMFEAGLLERVGRGHYRLPAR